MDSRRSSKRSRHRPSHDAEAPEAPCPVRPGHPRILLFGRPWYGDRFGSSSRFLSPPSSSLGYGGGGGVARAWHSAFAAFRLCLGDVAAAAVPSSSAWRHPRSLLSATSSSTSASGCSLNSSGRPSSRRQRTPRTAAGPSNERQQRQQQQQHQQLQEESTPSTTEAVDMQVDEDAEEEEDDDERERQGGRSAEEVVCRAASVQAHDE